MLTGIGGRNWNRHQYSDLDHLLKAESKVSAAYTFHVLWNRIDSDDETVLVREKSDARKQFVQSSPLFNTDISVSLQSIC